MQTFSNKTPGRCGASGGKAVIRETVSIFAEKPLALALELTFGGLTAQEGEEAFHVGKALPLAALDVAQENTPHRLTVFGRLPEAQQVRDLPILCGQCDPPSYNL